MDFDMCLYQAYGRVKSKGNEYSESNIVELEHMQKWEKKSPGQVGWTVKNSSRTLDSCGEDSESWGERQE